MLLFSKGHIEALDNMKLTVTFQPGVAEKFQKTFQVHTICIVLLYNIILGHIVLSRSR